MKPHLLIQLLISISLFILPVKKSLASLKWVEVGVNGLTCSACTRSVEMSMIRLEFVDSVVMNLEATEGRVYFKKGTTINLKKIAKAVVDAGFSVRFLRVVFNFEDMSVDQDGIFEYQGQSYQWLRYMDDLAKGDIALKLLDEGFMPRKESHQWKKKYGISNDSTHQKIFHVTHEL